MTTKQKREELKNDYEKFLNVKTDIEDIIFDIATKVDDFRNTIFNHIYEDFIIQDTHISCYWYDYCGQFGGGDSGRTTFPIELYYGDKSVEEYVQELDSTDNRRKMISKQNKLKKLKKEIEELKNKLKNINKS